jgi:hypothetical protein
MVNPTTFCKLCLRPCSDIFADPTYMNVSIPANGSFSYSKEPIFRHDPFVLNTQDEIQLALGNLRNDTFAKN